eukprot:3218102-Heterocapsa_arctica.AAC.1
MASGDAKDGFEKYLAFNGDVEAYPDWRLKAQASYAAADDNKRVTVAPRLFSHLTGAAWEAVKHIDPETLRNAQGIASLFALLDKEYQWQPISRLAKDLDDYLGLAPRRNGEGITSLIARNRAAMRRFIEA